MKSKLFNRIKGKQSESVAVLYLTKKHYKILQTNYSAKSGEIDIVAKQGKTIVFVEVKSRQDDSFGSPSQAVGKDKQRKIINTAKTYLLQKRITNTPIRFDVVEMIGEHINHIENAFDLT